MATVTSIVTAVNSTDYNGLLADDGSAQRVRDAQVAICTAFGGLNVPPGATINGIEFDMQGYATHTTFSNKFLSVSNNGGSSFSAVRNIETEPFTTSSTEGDWQIEQAGGATELWGLSWNPTTAAAIQIQIDSSTFDSGGYFWDWLKVKITYTEGYGNDVMGVDSSDIASISGVATADISKVNGV